MMSMCYVIAREQQACQNKGVGAQIYKTARLVQPAPAANHRNYALAERELRRWRVGVLTGY